MYVLLLSYIGWNLGLTIENEDLFVTIYILTCSGLAGATSTGILTKEFGLMFFLLLVVMIMRLCNELTLSFEMKHLTTLLLTLLVSGSLWADTNTKYEGKGELQPLKMIIRLRIKVNIRNTKRRRMTTHTDFNANGSIIYRLSL